MVLTSLKTRTHILKNNHMPSSANNKLLLRLHKLKSLAQQRKHVTNRSKARMHELLNKNVTGRSKARTKKYAFTSRPLLSRDRRRRSGRR